MNLQTELCYNVPGSVFYLSMNHVSKYGFVRVLRDAGGEVYLVGGSVRDRLLGRSTKDLDLIVRGIPLERLIKVLRPHGKTNLVGKSFGIIKFKPNEDESLEVDVALPRREVSTGTGHRDFDVVFDENLPLKEDLLRRDFTINAMAQDLFTGELIDPAGGQAHLKKREIHTVFANSFVQDPLRLLRAVQFASRFQFKIAQNTFAEMKEHAQLIKTVAPERIMMEVKKLFEAPKPSVGFNIMRDTGLLKYVFPDIQETIGIIQPKKRNEDVYTHTMKVLDAARGAEELDKPGDLDIMFSALFHDTGKPKTRREPAPNKVTFFNHQHVSTGIAWRWLKEYRATTVGVNPRHVCHLVKHHMFETKPFEGNDKALRRFINKVGPENIFDLLDLRLADKKGGRFPKKVYGILKLRERIREEINKKPPFTAKDLAVTGHDIMALGYRPGPVIGEIQRFLIDKVLEEPRLNTKEDLTRIILENKESFNGQSQQRQKHRQG